MPVSPAYTVTADIGLLLAEAALLDTVADETFWKRNAASTGSLLLKPAFRAAARRQPVFYEIMKERLKCLRVLETQRCPSVDRPAGAFAGILEAASDLLPCREGERVERPRRRLLASLGHWIYVLDAADDRADDRKHSRYNPIDARYPEAGEAEIQKNVRQLLEHLNRDMRASFALLPEGTATPVLRNIIELGMPAVASAILADRGKTAVLSRTRREQYGRSI